MITLRIEDISSFEDIEELKYQVQTDNPLYYKALKYKRYDVIMGLILNPESPIIEDFENAKKEDVLTNRYYHRVMWTEMIKRLKRDGIDMHGITHMKRVIINDLKLPIPFKGTCYACCRLCKDCEIGKKCGNCWIMGSTYDKLYNAFLANNRDAAIKYARGIRDAW